MISTDEILILCLMLVSGFVLGVLYFLGLWLTLKDLPSTKRWGLKVFVSFIIRVSLLAAAFFYLMGQDWERMVALIMGFWFARMVMIRRLRVNSPNKSHTEST